jgi:hypothetical protein
MSMEVVLVATDLKKPQKLNFQNYDLVRVLGTEEEAIAVRVSEVLKAISDTVASSIITESELTIEITGSMKLKAEGGVKWLVFNVGGGTESGDELKVVLKTKLNPAVVKTQGKF